MLQTTEEVITLNWHMVRPVVDVLMGIMLIFEMLYMLTGNVLHEVVGALFFATLVTHVILSRRRIKGIAVKAQRRQKLLLKQKAATGAVILLGIALLLLMVSSVLISNILSEATGLMLTSSVYDVFVLVHTACAYVVCIAAICHVGLHWVGLFRSLRIPYNPQRRKAINAGVTALVSAGAVAVGIAAVREMATWNELTRSAGGQPARDTDKQKEDSEGRRVGDRSGRKAKASGSVEEGSAGNARSDGSRPQGDGADQGVNGGESGWAGSGSGDSESAGSGSNFAVCTLCRKRCLLSAPKCDKPSAAGLI